MKGIEFFTTETVGPADNPMIERLRLIKTPWFGIYLHFIHREDLDRDPHDHPWRFWSLRLRGGYLEEYVADTRAPYRRTWTGTLVPRWHHFPLAAAHRITQVQPNTVTLVLVGRKVRDWGFYTDHGFVGWRDYIAQGRNPLRSVR